MLMYETRDTSNFDKLIGQIFVETILFIFFLKDSEFYFLNFLYEPFISLYFVQRLFVQM